jgi:predicted transposase/invertase (TIGR01784 family)
VPPKHFNALVSAVLEKEIKVTEVHAEYQKIEGKCGTIDIAYDLFGEDEENDTIIEVQIWGEPDFLARFRHYHYSAVISQGQKSQDYTPPKNVYTIVVLTGPPKDLTESAMELKSSWYGWDSQTILDSEELDSEEKRHRLIVLVPRLVSEKTPAHIRKWLELMNATFTNKFEKRIEVYEDEFDDEDVIFVDILNSIQFEMLTGREREVYDEEVRHKQAEVQQREEGRKEGRKEREEEIARKCLEMGLSEKQIQELLQ